jgi:DNA-binding response OmpR family regulator
MNDQSTPKKILIIDDNPAICSMLEKLLKIYHYRTVTANDGLSGLSAARTENPDLIVLDVMLPEMDGYKVCRMIKYDQKLKKIPVLILTSRMTPEDKRLAFECGANSYLPKATKTEVIIAEIRELLKKQQD